MSSFFSISFKKCNKLDDCIYNYIFIILIPLNNIFFIIKTVVVGVIKKKNLDFFYIVGFIEIDNHG